eukprot:432745-Rhodomonas_salina.3
MEGAGGGGGALTGGGGAGMAGAGAGGAGAWRHNSLAQPRASHSTRWREKKERTCMAELAHSHLLPKTLQELA